MLPAADFEGLEAAHRWISGFEMARNLAWEIEHHWDSISENLREGRLKDGLACSYERYCEMRALVDRCRERLAPLMGRHDILLAPAAAGEAPAGMHPVPHPYVYMIWTTMHVPSITLPVFEGSNGMPIGAQLVADRLSVLSYPTPVLLDASGRELLRLPGGLTEGEFDALLEKALRHARPLAELVSSALHAATTATLADLIWAAGGPTKDAGRLAMFAPGPASADVPAGGAPELARTNRDDALCLELDRLLHAGPRAQTLNPLVRPGDLLVLAGEMGAGKTAFVQGFAGALGVVDPVTSPTTVNCSRSVTWRPGLLSFNWPQGFRSFPSH